MVITITSNNLEMYLIVIVISLFLLIKIKKEFSEEGLLDYLIFITTKIILFFVFLTCLFISMILIITPSYNVLGFLSETISALLLYAFFNYGLCYFLKFWIYIKEFSEKNDLYTIKLLKNKGGLKR